MSRSAPMASPPGPATPADAVRAYVDQLEEWSATRADVLLQLDELARTTGSDADRLDVSIAFMSWRAVGARLEELRKLIPAAPGSGASKPSGPANLAATVIEAATSLIAQPVLGTDGATIATNTSEACNIVDTVITAARQSLGAAEESQRASTELRASARSNIAEAGRLADDLGEQVRHVAELATRLQRTDLEVTALEQLVADSAAALASLRAADRERAELLAALAAAPDRLAALRTREAAARALAERCRDRILQAPNLAVPSVDALGDLSGTPTASAAWSALRTTAVAWLARLDRLDDAFAEIERRFGAPLQERDDLRGVLQGFRDKAADGGIAETEHIGNLYETARSVLWSAPCDLEQARTATDAYISAVNLVLSGKV